MRSFLPTYLEAPSSSYHNFSHAEVLKSKCGLDVGTFFPILRSLSVLPAAYEIASPSRRDRLLAAHSTETCPS